LPSDLFAAVGEYDYRFLFACPEGLVEHEPSDSRPFPSTFEWGYNVIAFVPDEHEDRVSTAEPLRAERSPRLLGMTPPPRANHVSGRLLQP
jgi:hypothetical protein